MCFVAGSTVFQSGSGNTAVLADGAEVPGPVEAAGAGAGAAVDGDAAVVVAFDPLHDTARREAARQDTSNVGVRRRIRTTYPLARMTSVCHADITLRQPVGGYLGGKDRQGGIRMSGGVGKTRGPVVVWLLTIVTLGIYFLYWYFKVNEELRDHDASIEVSPGIATLAQFVPIANWVSFYNAGGRIRQAQRSDECSPIVGLL